MVLINYADHTVNCKIVYYGPGEGGKTTNLKYIFDNLDSSIRSDLTTLEGENARTVFFDHMSIDLGETNGFKTRFGLYSSPGQNEYETVRSLILNGVDGIIFVADSRKEKLEENIESLKNLENNLKEFGLSLDKMPIVFQYNKRDLDGILSVDTLEDNLNKLSFPSFETVATEGTGVFASLKALSNLILTGLQ